MNEMASHDEVTFHEGTLKEDAVLKWGEYRGI